MKKNNDDINKVSTFLSLCLLAHGKPTRDKESVYRAVILARTKKTTPTLRIACNNHFTLHYKPFFSVAQTVPYTREPVNDPAPNRSVPPSNPALSRKFISFYLFLLTCLTTAARMTSQVRQLSCKTRVSFTFCIPLSA